MSNVADQSGIVIAGQVSDVRSYIAKKSGEEKYSVRLFVPGSELIQVNLASPPDPKRFIPGELAKLRVNLSAFDGRNFFNEAA